MMREMMHLRSGRMHNDPEDDHTTHTRNDYLFSLRHFLPDVRILGLSIWERAKNKVGYLELARTVRSAINPPVNYLHTKYSGFTIKISLLEHNEIHWHLYDLVPDRCRCRR